MFSHARMQLNGGLAQARESSNLLADHLVELEILRGRTRCRRRAVSVPAYLIGRADDCDLVLADEGFPEAFAYILIRGRQVLLRHLGFAPDLLVNGRAITQVPLADGDVIQAGRYEFRVHVRPKENGHAEGSGTSGDVRMHPETKRVITHTDALAEALDLIRCIRREVLGEQVAFRLYLGPEDHLANVAALATLPVGSAAFSGRTSHEARSA